MHGAAITGVAYPKNADSLRDIAKPLVDGVVEHWSIIGADVLVQPIRLVEYSRGLPTMS